MKNEAKFKQLEQEIKDYAHKLDFFEITKKNWPREEEIGYCTISLQSPISCLEELDCMGIGLRINAPETAIVDPSRLHVLDVYPAYYTLNSFLEMAIFNQIQNKIYPDNQYGAIYKSEVSKSNEIINSQFETGKSYLERAKKRKRINNILS